MDPIVYNELGSSSEIALALSPDPSDPSAAPSEPQRAGKYLGAAGSTSTGSKNDEIDTNATKLPFQVNNLAVYSMKGRIIGQAGSNIDGIV